MRKIILFLILGAFLGFLILEYMVQDDGKRQKSRVRTVSPRTEPVPQEMAGVSTKRRQWEGTDESRHVVNDDLTLINGVGPAFARALNTLGIHTFAQLAEQNAADLAGRMTARITAERILRDRWIEQARELARSR
jgi:predicted flap endonuclease-1-like 5' DNA nuclease